MQTRRPCWGGAFLFEKSLELLLLEALEERVVEEAERIQVGDIFLRKFSDPVVEGGDAAEPVPEVAGFGMEKRDLLSQREHGMSPEVFHGFLARHQLFVPCLIEADIFLHERIESFAVHGVDDAEVDAQESLHLFGVLVGELAVGQQKNRLQSGELAAI